MPKGSFCKINISYPATGACKSILIEDLKKIHTLWGLRISSEFDGESVSSEFAGCVMKVTGGADAQGFPLMQGVLKDSRARLLLKEGQKCYRPRKDGEMKRKSVRGCILGPDLHSINLVLVKPGQSEIEGLTDTVIPKRLMPKRASKIRKMFGLPHKGLQPEDHMVVCKLVNKLRREVTTKNGRTYTKAPKVQRLCTDRVHARKIKLQKLKKARMLKSKMAAAEYHVMMAKYAKAQ